MPGQIQEISHEVGRRDNPLSVSSEARPAVFSTMRYRRTLHVSAREAFEAVALTVQHLGYPLGEEDRGQPPAIRFSALSRTVTARVVDTGPGDCVVVVDFASLRLLASGGSALVILPSVLLGALVKAHDACFARGFLRNVQRVLEGRDVGRDAATIRWTRALRDRLDVDDLRKGT